jgi:hypothetical protein
MPLVDQLADEVLQPVRVEVLEVKRVDRPRWLSLHNLRIAAAGADPVDSRTQAL